MITIVILFYLSNYRTFKHFYHFVCEHHKRDFTQLISYSRFVYTMKRLLVPLFAYLVHKQGAVTGISFVDSSSIKVCHNKRISRNKVFKPIAKRGKTTSGWFYGFKLHLIINDRGEILSFLLTPGHIADIKMLETLSQRLWGKLFGDKGYISSEIPKKLLSKGIQLFTGIPSNMKQKLMHFQVSSCLGKELS